jgi:hypothetical protein
LIVAAHAISVDPPVKLLHVIPGALIQVRVCRPKKRTHRGEEGATEIGETLPFLEYEIHRRLLRKLQLRGMNALFSLRIQVCHTYLLAFDFLCAD